MGGTTTSGSRRTASPGAPGLPEAALETIEEGLRRREERREELYARARRLRRSAQALMQRLHEGRATVEEAAGLRAEAAGLAAELEREPSSDRSAADDALQECAEASLLEAVVRGAPLPGPTELGLPNEPYLLGLGDVVGEVRRLALRALADDRPGRASELLDLMERLFLALMRFEAPRAIVALKPKQDVARSLLERTRGDVTMAMVLARARGPAPAGAEAPK